MSGSSVLEESLDLSSFEYDGVAGEALRADLKMEHLQSPSTTATLRESSVPLAHGKSSDISSMVMPLDDIQERLGHCSRQLQLVQKALNTSKDLTDGFDDTLTARHFLTPKAKERRKTRVSPSKRVSSARQHDIDTTLDLLEEFEGKTTESPVDVSLSHLSQGDVSRDGKMKSHEKESLLKSISNLEKLLVTKSRETRKLYDQIRRLKGGLAESRDRNTILASHVNELKHDLGSLQVQIELSESQRSRAKGDSDGMHDAFRLKRGMDDRGVVDLAKASSSVKLDQQQQQHIDDRSMIALLKTSSGLRTSQLLDVSDLTEGAMKLIQKLMKKTEEQQSMIEEKDVQIHELRMKVRKTQEMLEVKECHVQQLRSLVALRDEEMEFSGARSKRIIRRTRK